MTSFLELNLFKPSTFFAGVLCVGLMLGGCQRQEPTAPADAELNPVLAGVLQDTGLYQNPRITRVVGRRYLPGLNEWQMIVCFEHGLEGEPEKACEDGFRILPLQNGSWVVSLNTRNIHRWRELGTPETAKT